MFNQTPADSVRTRSDGEVLPLAFFYDDVAYYFDVDELDDSKSTIAVKGSNAAIEGKEANDMLLNAIRSYGADRNKCWIAPFFNGCVLAELEYAENR